MTKAAHKRLERTAADRIIRFVNNLTHTAGQWAGQPFALRPWQEAILRKLFGTLLPDGRRQYRTCYIEIPRKNGKGLALDTPIPSPTGWTTMGTVRVGDQLFDEVGQVCQVTAVSDVNHLDCYRMTFSNGEQIVADGDHRWLTSARVPQPRQARVRMLTAGDRTRTLPEWSAATGLKISTIDARLKRGWKSEDAIGLSAEEGIARRRRWTHEYAPQYRPNENWDRHAVKQVRTTRELFETLTFGKRSARNHSLAMPDALDLPERSLPIDPYVLGAWLGDGTSRQAQLTCRTQDLDHFVGEIQAAGCVTTVRRDKTAWRVSIQSAESQLFGAKRIPVQYLRASMKQRLALLQGLMDTDGTCDQRGRAMIYTTTSELLAGDVAELLATMGIKYSWRQKRIRCNGRSVPGIAHDLQFHVTLDRFPVFRLQRKLDRQPVAQIASTRTRGRASSRRSRTLQIVAIERIETVPTRCLAVDSPSSLFRVGRTMLPTHNTELAAAVALYMLLGDQEGRAEV